LSPTAPAGAPARPARPGRSTNGPGPVTRLCTPCSVRARACWECARRLGWSLNTVKRYARAATAEQLQRPPRYGRTLVDPYRNHLRRRVATEPGVAVTRLLEEIRELGYSGSANLLVRYLAQGRADAERTSPSPRRLVSWIMARPADLPENDRDHLDELLAACPHLTVLTEQVRAFAELLTTRCGADLEGWMSTVEASELLSLHPFVAACARTCRQWLRG
jgi:hypothetical protein